MDLTTRFPHLFYVDPAPVPTPPQVVAQRTPNATPSSVQLIAACLESYGLVGNTQAMALDLLSVIDAFKAMTTPAPASTSSASTSTTSTSTSTTV